MLNKKQLTENVEKKLGIFLTLPGIKKDLIVDFIQDQIILYGKPACLKCYDKAYSTSIYGLTASADFEGDKDLNKPIRTRILYCDCQRGQDLRKVIEENYIARS